MNRRLVTAGLAAGLSAALSIPVLAQQPTIVSPIPVQPVPAENQAGGGLAGPQGAQTNQDRINRTQQGGSPADTTTPRRQGQQASDPASGGQQSREQAQAQQRNPAEIQYIQQTMAAGTVTFQASTFARAKAQNPRVKQFAAFEEAEQNAMFEVLHATADPGTTSGTNTQAAQATSAAQPSTSSQAAATAPVISGTGSEAMERMSKAEPGPIFDRDYIALQIQGHRELLGIQERYLTSNPGNRGTAAIARLAMGQIREHLALLEDIQKELGR